MSNESTRDAAWVRIETPFPPWWLGEFLADPERIYRINSLLEVRVWEQERPELIRFEALNLSNGKTIETPCEKNVLPGITRAVIMEILAELGYPVRENFIRPDELSRFDEAFFSGTLNFVQPVSRIEDTQFTCPGQITSTIKEKIHDVFTASTSRYDRWISYIK